MTHQDQDQLTALADLARLAAAEAEIPVAGAVNLPDIPPVVRSGASVAVPLAADPAAVAHLITYTAADGTLVMANQEAFADGEMAGHLAACRPAERSGLAATFAALRAADEALLAAATPAQRAIGWGDCWAWRSPGGLVCYGYVETWTDVTLAELAACKRHGLSREQAEDDVRRRLGFICENYARGWRSGRGYSVIEPEGEPGYSHVAFLTRISRAEFADAAARGWQ